MSWIKTIQSQPRAKKIRTIWIITITAFVVMLVVWIVIGNYRSGSGADFSLFKTFGNGIKELGKQKFKPAVQNNTITPVPLPQSTNQTSN